MNSEYFSLPLAEPLTIAAGEITEREGFLVSVDEPTAGLGEACPLPGWTESVDECRRALRETDSDEIAGLPPAARHGAVLALLDAEARDEDVPLYRYLGRETRVDSVAVNATVGDADASTTADRVSAAVSEGFESVKLKLGARSLDADLERVHAAREGAPDAELRLDANGAWDRETATRAISAAADYGVSYIEQPLPADDLAGHATLRGSGVGIALDEGLYEHGLDAVLEAEAADTLILKPMAMGGPDIALETAVVARGAGIDPVVTTTIDGAVARAAAVHVAAAIPDVSPCGLATGELLAADFQPDPAPVEAGRAQVPQQAGNTAAISPADYA